MELLKLAMIKDQFLFSLKVFHHCWYFYKICWKWIYRKMKQEKKRLTHCKSTFFFSFKDYTYQIAGKVSECLVSSSVLRPVACGLAHSLQTTLNNSKYRPFTRASQDGRHGQCASRDQLIHCSKQSLPSPTSYTRRKWGSGRLSHLPKITRRISRAGI